MREAPPRNDYRKDSFTPASSTDFMRRREAAKKQVLTELKDELSSDGTYSKDDQALVAITGVKIALRGFRYDDEVRRAIALNGTQGAARLLPDPIVEMRQMADEALAKRKVDE